ncbi:MAG: hypothetical protein ACFB2Z_05430 [Maricaulaceae bacterium]
MGSPSASHAALDELSHAWTGLRAIIGFQSDWTARFDVSATGVIRSFGAVFAWGLPLFALVFMAQNRLILANPEFGAEERSFVYGVLSYLLLWAHFPLVAAVLLQIIGRMDKLFTYLVVHNWAVLLILFLESFVWAGQALGVSLETASALTIVTLCFGLYLHCRVASVTLAVPAGVAIGAACSHVLVAAIIEVVLAQAFGFGPSSG